MPGLDLATPPARCGCSLGLASPIWLLDWAARPAFRAYLIDLGWIWDDLGSNLVHLSSILDVCARAGRLARRRGDFRKNYTNPRNTCKKHVFLLVSRMSTHKVPAGARALVPAGALVPRLSLRAVGPLVPVWCPRVPEPWCPLVRWCPDCRLETSFSWCPLCFLLFALLLILLLLLLLLFVFCFLFFAFLVWGLRWYNLKKMKI